MSPGTVTRRFTLPEQALNADAPEFAIGQRIREAREARSLTQQAVSARSKWVDPEKKGISRTALIGYEAGTSRPGTRELRILCETLGVTPNVLVFGSEHPFKATHVAREGLDKVGGTLSEVVQIAFVLGALKGHEKDALLSLALSLAGRQLGDLRVSGLRAIAAMVAPAVAAELERQLPDDHKLDIQSAPLEKLVDLLSRGVGSNIGNKLTFEGEELTGGTWQYPDPDPDPDVARHSDPKKS